ncbi:MAG: PqqD family protein [Bdellovibrionales bacterium]|nr:PqqD family protein [Bdellovibrionales bacterium]
MNMKQTQKKKKFSSKPNNKNGLSTILKVGDGVLHQKSPKGDVTLIHENDTRHVYKLDRIAAEFWTLIDGKRSLATIVKRLERKHRVSSDVLAAEARKLIAKLERARLVR